MRAMAKLTAFCAVLLFTAVSLAGQTLVVTKSGYYLMDYDSSGVPQTPVKITSVIVKGDPGTVPPVDTPPDVTTDPIATQVKGWAVAVNDPMTAQGLALVYRKVGERAAGQSRENVMGALRDATNEWLTTRKTAEAWKVWRANLSKLIDEQEATGPIDWTKFCASVDKGLTDSAPQTALPPELFALLLRLLELIITRFLGGIGGGGGTGV